MFPGKRTEGVEEEKKDESSAKKRQLEPDDSEKENDPNRPFQLEYIKKNFINP